MGDIPPEWVEPLNHVWAARRVGRFIAGAIIGHFLMMAFFGVLERPLKFRRP